MKKEYFPKEIEFYVQKEWESKKTFKVNINYNKKKFYCLSMLPYPSGKLHMGHVRNYTIGDVIARYQRMLGKNVLHPIGWDAFGLPAEIAAHNHGIAPNIWTKKNIKYMKKQLKLLGFSFDWDREITTCDPNYYRWEQWFFLKLYNLGLAYKKKDIVNWCPIDKTILANEQVIDKCCWRCHSLVKKKLVEQWFLKITNYAEELLSDLNKLNYWPQKVKNMQKNWIGKIEGINIIFQLYNTNYKFNVFIKKKYFFALKNIFFIKILYNHPICKKFIKNKKIKDFIKRYSSLYPNDKENKFLFNQVNYINSKLFAQNNIIIKKKIQIIIVNYLSNSNKINATIGIPQCNKKDFSFVQKYKALFLSQNKISNLDKYTKGNNNLLIKKLIFKKKAFYKKYYNLKDWSISRQRIWGTPIPIIIKKNKKFVPLQKNELPLIFPKKILNENIKENYNKKIKNNLDWFQYNRNGIIGQLETDTFDTFIESSWYYARYTSNKENNKMINKKYANYWLPVDQYIGGIEHATMHLIYFRFFHKLMRDIGLLNTDEPVKKLLCQGMVLANSYYYLDKEKKYHWVKEKNIIFDKKNNIFLDKKGRRLINHGMIKMSKSKNNGVNPQHIIEKYGADSLRLFIMFAAPPTIDLEWQETGIKGMHKFLKKIWKFIYEYKKLSFNYEKIKKDKLCSLYNKEQLIMQDYANKTIIKVTNNFEKNQSFNTVISSIMIFFNKIKKYKIHNNVDYTIIFDSLLIILKMLYPFTPHFCFVLWKHMGKKNDIDQASWPIIIKINTKKIKDTFDLVIQIDGKKKYNLSIPEKIKYQETNIKNYVLSNNNISKFLVNIKIIKIIYIPQKILNIVTKKK
ncbi:leucine--tRNA ligase [Enterobacteriaceae endosymbiont of Donacia bicoloricornis]|uniref:leucine--tRNA ligase n=1 Tax=Enterobacteriaceae endosymbiont of Donacia bicoloricornis TaxID=2675772 RepID=UPI001448FA76|nr:leucine--tRNA ligase [Enterobacteriaceae endosymbiont of Donacia bicoloricornis]QJC37814.1 leucine--tRNA ligase [Enterobacteriaceae endosymbiont of Donacia bicoloricornis]